MWIFFSILSLAFIGLLNGQSYEDTDSIFKDFLNNSYNTDVVPITNQSATIYILVDFNLMSIVAVDDTTESFVCNGFLTFLWRDERIRWDPRRYGGKDRIYPKPAQIWRPRVILLNTLGDRDLFADDISPVSISSRGEALWAPGSLFTSSCSLNLLKYPYDEQICSIQMISMALPEPELEFLAGRAQLEFFTSNGEWDVKDLTIAAFTRSTSGVSLSSFDINIRMKRRPMFYMLNIILPFVFLSLLNLLVFIIPQESGEKIGFGITVLLALSVFFSIIGGMLPRSSETVPYVIIYLFLLYVISTLAVIDSIIVGFIYHMEEREEYHRKIRNKFKNMIEKISKSKKIVTVWSMDSKIMHLDTNETANKGNEKERNVPSASTKRLKSRSTDKIGPGEEKEKGQVKSPKSIRHKVTASIVDFFSGLAFILAWITVTIWYFVSVFS